MSFILKFSFGKLLLPTGTKSIASPLIAFQERDLAKLPPSFEVGGGGGGGGVGLEPPLPCLYLLLLLCRCIYIILYATRSNLLCTCMDRVARKAPQNLSTIESTGHLNPVTIAVVHATLCLAWFPMIHDKSVITILYIGAIVDCPANLFTSSSAIVPIA